MQHRQPLSHGCEGGHAAQTARVPMVRRRTCSTDSLCTMGGGRTCSTYSSQTMVEREDVQHIQLSDHGRGEEEGGYPTIPPWYLGCSYSVMCGYPPFFPGWTSWCILLLLGPASTARWSEVGSDKTLGSVPENPVGGRASSS